MKKNIIIGILVSLLIVLIGIFWLGKKALNDYDTQNFEIYNQQAQEENLPHEQDEVSKDENEIIVFAPETFETISSPLKVRGQAQGTWFFEAVAGLKVVADDGTVLGEHYIQTTQDWMSLNKVDFEGQVEFDSQNYEKGFVVFSNDNPTGLSEFDKSYALPVFFNKKPTELTVDVYFSNIEKDPEMLDCSNVYVVERKIPYTKGVAKASLIELLKGVTSEEFDLGYRTSINDDVKINSIVIKDGIAKVDFDDKLQYQVGGSCRVTAIYSQIKNTLMQFSTVNEVVISINGQTSDILQP